MAHKVRFNNESRTVTGGRGVLGYDVRNILHGRTLVRGAYRTIEFGIEIGKLAVGEIVMLNVDGVPTEFIIVNQGIPVSPVTGEPSELYDASCDGTWLLSKDILFRARFHSGTSSDGINYSEADINDDLDVDLFGKLDPGVQSVVKEVKVPYSVLAGKVLYGSNGLPVKVFLLSIPEVGASTMLPAKGEGVVLAYFSDADDEKRVANIFGKPEDYYLRSYYNGSDNFCISEDGDDKVVSALSWSGIRPALVVDSDAKVFKTTRGFLKAAPEGEHYTVSVPNEIPSTIGVSEMHGGTDDILAGEYVFAKGSEIYFFCYSGKVLLNGEEQPEGKVYVKINRNLTVTTDGTNLILSEQSHTVTVTNQFNTGNAYIDDTIFHTGVAVGEFPFIVKYLYGNAVNFHCNGNIMLNGSLVEFDGVYSHNIVGNLTVTGVDNDDGTTDLFIIDHSAVVYDPVFEKNSWETIITACQSGVIPDTWAVGDSKPMTIDGEDYLIDIIGQNHDTYATGGIAPLTFQLHDSYAKAAKMNSTNSNIGGWRDCDMRSDHLPAFKTLMPEGIQTAIRKVTKLTSEGDKSTTLVATEDDLFLLAEREFFSESASWVSAKGEGTQYAYYAAGNSVVKRMINGSRQAHLTRSPRVGTAYEYCVVHGNGFTSYSQATFATAFAPAFCF